MQRAETVLGIIRERGTRGLPLNNIYRQLFNPDLYLRAYAKLYSNDGAMTRGITTETVDAMALGTSQGSSTALNATPAPIPTMTKAPVPVNPVLSCSQVIQNPGTNRSHESP